MITTKTWQAQMSEDMRLRDFRPKTQEAYLLAVKQFMAWAKREPDQLRDEDVRAYFLYLRENKKLAPSTINIAVHALRRGRTPRPQDPSTREAKKQPPHRFRTPRGRRAEADRAHRRHGLPLPRRRSSSLAMTPLA